MLPPVMFRRLLKLFAISMIATALGCGGGGGGSGTGGGSNNGPQDDPPVIGAVRSSALSDTDNAYPTGRLVRIDIEETSGESDLASGTIQITSASQGYDSGVQPLSFGSIFYSWDTSGLNPANDYQIAISLIDIGGNIVTAKPLTITLAPNPPLINKLISDVDTSFPSVGLPTQFTRTYLLDSTFNGPMGYGWTHNYRTRILETYTANQSTHLSGFVQIAGLVQLFNADGTASYFKPNFDGTYQSQKGDFRTLAKAPNGVYTLREKNGDRTYFSGNGKPFRIEDTNGNATTLQYDSADVLVSVTDASGQVTAISYDINHRIRKVTDPAGREVMYDYDAAGNLATVTDVASGATTNYAYDAQHNLTTITDPLGKRTFFTVDSQDRLASVSGEGGSNSISFAYASPAPNQMTITDAQGQVTTLTYDNNASVTAVTDALGRSTQLSYDSNLNLASVTDANGGLSRFSYDTKGNLTSTTDASGGQTTLTYDPTYNQVTSLTDANGNTTAFAYDPAGNLTQTTYPGGAKEQFTYDAAGNLATKTDRNNQTIGYNYDAAGQLVQKSFPDGSADVFGYDASGNLRTATDNSGTISLVYDSADRLIQVQYPAGETVSYAYDAAGNRSRMIYPTGRVLDYTYDSLNRLTAIVSGGAAVASYSYDSLGRVTRRDLQNGTNTTYSYDTASQLTNLVNRKSSGNVISSFAYTYDLTGNRTSMTDLTGTTSYVYDAIGQLVRVTDPGSLVTDYVLDAAGNRASVTDATGTDAYTSNALNQYTNVNGDTYSYDANGNTVRKTTAAGTTTFTYDYENQLTQVATPTETVSYAYDPFGRRASKTTASGRTNYIHDGSHVITETDAAAVVVAEYVYGARIDEILLMRRGGVDYFYSQDGLTSVADLTDSAENIVESYSYDAYGSPTSASAVGNPYLYTSREYEAEAGLYFYRARFYDPKIGRFINEDPIGYLGGDTNFYSYVSNAPTKFVDPSGLAFDDPGVIDPNKFGNEDYWTEGQYIEEPYYVHIENLEKPYVPWFVNPNTRINPRSPPPWWFIIGRTIFESLEKVIGPSPVIPTFSTQTGGNTGNAAGQGGNNNSGKTCQATPPSLCVSDPTFVQGGNVATDFLAGGNRIDTEAHRLFASIAVPFEGSLIRADVPVFGLAYGTDFKEYRVEFGKGANPSTWTTLKTTSNPQVNPVTEQDLDDSLNLTIQGNLANWDTGLTNYVYLPSHPKDHPIDLNGTYTVRLVVTGKDGSEVEDRVTVHVTNVIPNAIGGVIQSNDARVTLTVPEQAIQDSFRLIAIQAADTGLPTANAEIVGNVYQVREPGERFNKPAKLRMVFDPETLGTGDPSRLGIYGYNAKESAWEYVVSTRRPNDSAVYADVRRLHHFYALMLSEQFAEGSELVGELAARAVSATKVHTVNGPYLVMNDFESHTGEWSNRDHEVGGEVSLDDSVTFDGSRALKISNTNEGGNFAVNVVTTPFDARDFPVVQFDYRISQDVKTNILAKVAGRWYEVGFTDDAHELAGNRVNIARIGAIENVETDDQWHTAQFNLYDMLRTKTGNTRVEAVIMADWDVDGYMLLQYGSNSKGATYYVDNFSIRREHNAGLRMAGERILIDDFNQKKSVNRLGGPASIFFNEGGGQIETMFVNDGFQSGDEGNVRGHALALSYDVSSADSFAGYQSDLGGLDLRDYQAVQFAFKAEDEAKKMLLGLKDARGNEHKIPVNQYLSDKSSETWQQVTIPLAAFPDSIDRSDIQSLNMSFEHALHPVGTVYIDDIGLNKTLRTVLVDDFEQTEAINQLGGLHETFISGAAAVSGNHTYGSPNGIYRLSYGGNIGAINAYASELKSFAGWKSKLGGIDCSACGNLNFKVRGAVGEENATVYLHDGNFRWGIEIVDYTQVTDQWQRISIPLQAFAEYGVDLTHLAELQVVFEGAGMSGTIYLDNIDFSALAE